MVSKNQLLTFVRDQHRKCREIKFGYSSACEKGGEKNNSAFANQVKANRRISVAIFCLKNLVVTVPTNAMKTDNDS